MHAHIHTNVHRYVMRKYECMSLSPLSLSLYIYIYLNIYTQYYKKEF